VVTLRTITFEIRKFPVFPTECVFMFCMDLRRNSYSFSIQH